MTTEMNAPVSLEWTPTGPGAWELVGVGARHARLERSERTWTAEGPRGVWALQKVGFYRPRVVVRPKGQLAEVAHVQPDWRGIGTIRFADGVPFEAERTPSGSGLTIRDGARHTVAKLTWVDGLDAPAAHATVAGSLVADGKALLLLLLGWHTHLEELGDPGWPVTLGERRNTPSVRARFR
jgi:hypothetical protein